MSDVFINGRGLASALGADLAQAVGALRRGGVAPGAFEIAPGEATPYFPLATSDDDGPGRARRRVLAAVAESGALAARGGTLWLASTSLDMPARERDAGLAYDLQAFAEQCGAWLDWRGPILTVCTACTSAVNALLGAATQLRAGDADDALVLGVELANRFTLGGFQAMQLLAARGAQPLGAARDGLVLGEAVAALHLSRRPARWRLRGGANVVDSSDPAGAASDAVAQMCRQALARSGLVPRQIDLVKLQAAGSAHNDAVEVAGLRQVFDPLPALVSLKAQLGHTLGAAGAAEIALLTACIEADLWPRPNYALDSGLRVSLAEIAPRRLHFILANILGFGGGHAAVVLEDTHTAEAL